MICAALLASSCLSSCKTKELYLKPVPTIVQDQSASYDGNKKDSGLIDVTLDGAVVTSFFVQRYNAMILDYGNDPIFRPPLKESDGVEKAPDIIQSKYLNRGIVFLMTHQALSNFIQMNQWRKMGKKPYSGPKISPEEKEEKGILSKVLDKINPF